MSAGTMLYLSWDPQGNLVERKNPEAELARLTWIIVTPEPTIGASSISTSSNRRTVSETIVKDAVLFALEAIVQSSDVFPPIKSAASGLLFFTTSVEMASSNKKQVRDIYKRIDGLATSLKRGATNDGMISPAHQNAIRILAEDIAALNEELENIVAERKSRFKRFFSAKRHRAELQDVTAVATLNATTNAQVLAHVQALTLVMGVQPIPLLGTRRADAVAFPTRTTRV
ncbi:hypothetical protein PENSPDRAFT_753386 [Peniophora sp. CONT]|nr:hypothetical protein PENSPDRAFT_753386 [Peniophora sp. CONT]